MIYAVDFDGTIVKNKYPEIGELFPHCLDVLRRLQKNGDEVILWTCRTGNELQSAIDFLENNNFIPDKINDHSEKAKKAYPDSRPRKIYADFYIDDNSYLLKLNNMNMIELWSDFAKRIGV